MNLVIGNNKKYLVETALLGQGLNSISDNKLRKEWIDKEKNITWILNGKIQFGDIDDFIKYRNKSQIENWIRVDGKNINKVLEKKENGLLTASGTMSVAKKIGCKIVVSAGIGGIGNIKGEEFCYDLIALTKDKVILVATSFKDMLDIEASIKWLLEKEVKVLGYKTDYCNGFIFKRNNIKLSGFYNGKSIKSYDLKKGVLILNPIKLEKRFDNIKILSEAVKKATEEANEEKHFHPLANANIDILTNGESSKLQLRSLLDNIEIAKKL